MIQVMQSDTPNGFPRAWTTTGYVVCAVSGLFVGRIVYEETILTWTNGPQMVGFALDHMPRTRDEIFESRRRVKAEYGTLFDSVSTLLYRHNPIGINFEENTDEYDLEAETILPRLQRCHNLEDVHNAVYSEFVRWFDADTAGPPEHCKQIASEIWQLWQEYLARNQSS